MFEGPSPLGSELLTHPGTASCPLLGWARSDDAQSLLVRMRRLSSLGVDLDFGRGRPAFWVGDPRPMIGRLERMPS